MKKKTTNNKNVTKKIIIALIVLSIFSLFPASFCIIIADNLINSHTQKFHSSGLDGLPVLKAGLVPGTSKHLGDGSDNWYFKYRIKAANEAFKAGKISAIVISGDNGSIYYNEPMDMKKALLELGIPDSLIYLDYAGFRTFDSVVRMDKIFGQKHFLIISQEFQNERAIYIAQTLGLTAYGYDAHDINPYYGFKTQVRERFARVKVFIDLLFNTKPKFLGEKIIIK